MRFLITCVLYVFCLTASATAPDRASLLSAWEASQRNLPLVAELTKQGEDAYHIKFAKLPFEGTLQILSVDINDMGNHNNDITHYGYVEIDLVNLPKDFIQKYEHSYYKWKDDHNLYFNSKTQQWLDTKAYQAQIEATNLNATPQNWFWSLLQYWDYILMAILAFFVFSQISNNKKVKQSIALQEEAFSLQAKAIQESTNLHKETNAHLKALIDLLKQQNQ